MLWWYAPSVVVRAGYMRGWSPPRGTYNGYQGILSYMHSIRVTRVFVSLRSSHAYATDAELYRYGTATHNGQRPTTRWFPNTVVPHTASAMAPACRGLPRPRGPPLASVVTSCGHRAANGTTMVRETRLRVSARRRQPAGCRVPHQLRDGRVLCEQIR